MPQIGPDSVLSTTLARAEGMNPIYVTVHAYFPELSSFESYCDAFDGLCSPLLSSSIADFFPAGDESHCLSSCASHPASSIEAKSASFRLITTAKCKQLRLVEGRLQVVGFSGEFAVINKSGKQCTKIQKSKWKEVMRYLLR